MTPSFLSISIDKLFWSYFLLWIKSSLL